MLDEQKRRKITKANSIQWHHSDLFTAVATQNGFRFFTISYRFTLCACFFRVTFLTMPFFYLSTLLIANALLFIFPFWFSASHEPLLMNNYYSKYLVYIVHLHSLFNYAIRILINPNSFFCCCCFLDTGPNWVREYCAHHSSRKKNAEHKKIRLKWIEWNF